MNTEDIIKQLEEKIEHHGCHSCWSDDHNCTCEQEKTTMRGVLVDFSQSLDSYKKGLLEKIEGMKAAWITDLSEDFPHRANILKVKGYNIALKEIKTLISE